jgi:predicted acyltransferase
MSTTLPLPTRTSEPVVERPPAVVDNPRATRERLLSLDVFRGLTVAGMLLVNDPGTWSAIYPPLEHAEWNGWTPTDLIFPFFLFIVGITTYLSLSARRARGDDDRALVRQIIRRGAMIFLIGLLINGFPFFSWGSVTGVADPSVLQRIGDRLLHWRIMGVLQRIGVVYLCAALLTFRTTVKQQILTLAGLLIGYWVVMTCLPVPDTGALGATMLNVPPHTMAAWLDRLLLDWSRFGLGNHTWVSSQTWDPEGTLSTIPAIGTAILGNMAGRWIGSNRSLSERLNGLFAAGALLMAGGLVWNWGFPINKSLWTSSYVLFCAGMASIALATVMWIVDLHQMKSWTKPAVIYGMNPIVAFAGSGVLARLIYSIIKVNYQGQPTMLETAIYKSVFLSWLAPVNASLAFAITFVLFWYVILWAMYKRNIFVKV